MCFLVFFFFADVEHITKLTSNLDHLYHLVNSALSTACNSQPDELTFYKDGFTKFLKQNCEGQSQNSDSSGSANDSDVNSD